MTRRINRWLLALAVLIGVPFWWLLAANDLGGTEAYPLHMAELRAAAGTMPGARPARVEIETMATRLVPGTVVAAGIGVKRRPLAIVAYRLPVPGGKPIVIDSGTTAAQTAALGFKHFVPEARERIDAAMAQAGLILATSERTEHLGGLVTLAGAPGGAKWLRNVRLTPGQLASVAGRQQTWPAGARPVVGPAGPAPQAVAPGVVVFAAPGETPGAQMIYVALGNGREYLFTGDTATLEANWLQGRARSRLLDLWFVHEDRAAVGRWLLTVRQLKREAPRLLIVPGHDFDWLWFQASHGNVAAGFGKD